MGPSSSDAVTVAVSVKQVDGSLTQLWSEHIPPVDLSPETYQTGKGYGTANNADWRQRRELSSDTGHSGRPVSDIDRLDAE